MTDPHRDGEIVPRVTPRLVAWNGISGGLLLVVRIAVTFVVSPVVVHALGNLRYGAWELAIGIIGYMGLLDLGLSPALVRHVAHEMGRRRPREAAAFLRTALRIYFLLGLLAAGACLGVAAVPGLLFGPRAAEVPGLLPVLFLVALDVVVRLPGSAVTAWWYGIQRHALVNGLDAVVAVLQGGLTLALVPRAPGSPLVTLASIVVGLMLLRYALLSALLAARWRPLLLRSPAGGRERLAALFSFGGKSMLLQTATLLNRELIPVIIAHVVSLGSVVFFAIPGRLFEYSRQLAYAVSAPLTAFFSHALGEGDRDRLRDRWVRSARPVQALYLGSAVGIAALGPSFLERWMGAEIAEGGRVVVHWLAAGLAAEAIGVNTVRLLTASARHGVAAVLQGLTGLVAAVLAWFLGRAWGLAGVVVPLAVMQVLRQFLLLGLASRLLSLRPGRYLLGTAGLFAAPVLAMAGVLHLAGPVPDPVTWSGIGGRALLGSAAFLAAALVVPALRREMASLAGIVFRPGRSAG